MIEESKGMESVCDLVKVYAPRNEPVLIVGETGVGKELVARALHEKSRRTGDFVPVNSYDFLSNPALAHSQIFGHKRGSFTGAVADYDGQIGRAKGGTLFIDEIGWLDPAVQGALLRFIETGEYNKLGSTRVEMSDRRIIAATNRMKPERENGEIDETANKPTENKNWKFGLRDDLSWRFVFQIEVRPLRRRRRGVVELFLRFCDENCDQEGIDHIQSFPAALVHILLMNEWKGNVRQLKNETLAYVCVDKRLYHHPMQSMSNWVGAYTWFLDWDAYWGGEYFSERWVTPEIGFHAMAPFNWLTSFIERKDLEEWALGKNQRLSALVSEYEYHIHAENFLLARASEVFHRNPLDDHTGEEDPLDFFRLHRANWALENEAGDVIDESGTSVPACRFVANIDWPIKKLEQHFVKSSFGQE